MDTNILGRFPSNMILYCAAATAIIPYLFVKINSKLSKHTDPPWKKNN